MMEIFRYYEPDPTRHNLRVEFDFFKFPGGEMHIKFKQRLSPACTYTIAQKIQSSDDLMLIALAVDVLRRQGIGYIILEIPYIPYARQDRPGSLHEPLSSKVFANIINSLNFTAVRGYDAHSHVIEGLIDNYQSMPCFSAPLKFFKTHGFNEKSILISPDAGAQKKVRQFKNAWHLPNTIVSCLKERDEHAGYVHGVFVYGDVKDKDCYIFDDICDGGATFIKLADALKSQGARNLYLFVSHGIFSKGVEELFKHYNAIGCTDSVRDIFPPLIEVYSYEQFL